MAASLSQRNESECRLKSASGPFGALRSILPRSSGPLGHLTRKRGCCCCGALPNVQTARLAPRHHRDASIWFVSRASSPLLRSSAAVQLRGLMGLQRAPLDGFLVAAAAAAPRADSARAAVYIAAFRSGTVQRPAQTPARRPARFQSRDRKRTPCFCVCKSAQTILLSIPRLGFYSEFGHDPKCVRLARAAGTCSGFIPGGEEVE